MTFVLTIDGVDKSEADLVAAGVSIKARAAYTDAETIEFETTDTFDQVAPLLVTGQVVRLKIDGTVVAYGKVIERARSFNPGEGRTFGVLPARELARNVAIEHPRTKAAVVDFNLGATTDLHPTALEGLSIGEMIAWILDAHATKLRAQGAAPPVGDLYVALDLAGGAMDAEVSEVTVSGDVVSAIETLLSMTKCALVIDPDTLQWRFQDRTAGAYYEVDLGTEHAIGAYQVDAGRNFTAAELRGTAPETQDTLLSLAGGDLAMPAADAAKAETMSAAGRYNEDHWTVGKLWELADGDLGILEELCAQARVTSADGSLEVPVVVRGATPSVGASSIALSMPAVGLANPSEAAAVCEEGGPASAAASGGLSVTLPTYSRTNPSVPILRWPTDEDAWYGSAFSTDPADWEVDGATPAAGSLGLQRLRAFNAPKFRGTVPERAAWAAVLEDLVKVGGTLGRDCRFTIARLDPSLALLGQRLRVKDTGGRTTGLESETDLAIVGVEWDLTRATTTIVAGSPLGLFDVEQLRASLAAKQGADRNERSLNAARALMECFRSQDQALAQGDIGPLQICGGQVNVRDPKGPPKTVDDVVPPLPPAMDGILDLLSWQKGGKFTMEKDVDSGEWHMFWENTTGEKHRREADGSWTSLENGEISPKDRPPMGNDPDGEDGPQPHLPTIGVEGWMARALLLCLANLGKTTDVNGDGVKPGGVVPHGGAVTWGHNGAGDVCGTGLEPGAIVPPTVLGGTLANLSKTKGPVGILEPGTTIP